MVSVYLNLTEKKRSPHDHCAIQINVYIQNYYFDLVLEYSLQTAQLEVFSLLVSRLVKCVIPGLEKYK